MSKQAALLKRISITRFAAWELHIYLDTHPADKNALKRFEQYQAKADRLTAEYEAEYGPLTAGDVYGDNRWEWVNSPWPWECGEVND